MRSICDNLIILLLVKLSLSEKNSLIGLVMDITCIGLAYVLTYKVLAKLYKGNKKQLEFAIIAACTMIVYYGLTIEMSEYDKSEFGYILFELLYLISLVQEHSSTPHITESGRNKAVEEESSIQYGFEGNEQKVRQHVTLNSEIKHSEIKSDMQEVRQYMTYECRDVIRELDMALREIEISEENRYKNYLKIKGLRKIEKIGLNIHKYTVCYSIDELIKACSKYEFICTIRTDIDKRKTDRENTYPFYIVHNESELDVDRMKEEIFDKHYVAIVANGLRYDKDLVYNMVLCIERNGDFLVEYSFENVPLRNMYKHGDKLHAITGNIKLKISEWNRNFVGNDNKLDLRILKDILNEHYMICYNNDLFGRYIELSHYSIGCGILNKKEVYWEI